MPDSDQQPRKDTGPPRQLSLVRTAVFALAFIAIMAILPVGASRISDDKLSHSVGVVVGLAVFAALFYLIRPDRGKP